MFNNSLNSHGVRSIVCIAVNIVTIYIRFMFYLFPVFFISVQYVFVSYCHELSLPFPGVILMMARISWKIVYIRCLIRTNYVLNILLKNVPIIFVNGIYYYYLFK